MSGKYGNMPFGLRQVRLMNAAGTIKVDLDAPRTLSFVERIKSGELEGGDTTQALVAYGNGVDWSLEEGGIPLEAYALMTGRTVSEVGSTPNQTKTLSGGLDTFPYFQIYGKSIGDGADDVHCKIYKAKLMKAPEGRFQNGQFFVTNCSGIGLLNNSGKAFDFVQNETADDLPDVAGSGS